MRHYLRAYMDARRADRLSRAQSVAFVACAVAMAAAFVLGCII